MDEDGILYDIETSAEPPTPPRVSLCWRALAVVLTLAVLTLAVLTVSVALLRGRGGRNRSMTYVGASGAALTGTVPLTKLSFDHLGSEWNGTFVPSEEPGGWRTPVYQTLTASEAGGSTRVILTTSFLLSLSQCSHVQPATTTATPTPPSTAPTTESSTTTGPPLP